jgi:hypothetical protein
MSHHSTINRAFISLAIGWVCALASLVLMAGFESTHREIAYITPIGIQDISDLMFNADWKGFKKLFSNNINDSTLYILWIIGLLIATFVTILTRWQLVSKTRCNVYAIQWLFCWLGVIGIISLPFDLISLITNSLDGEWLGETWPILEAMSIWLILSTINFIHERKLIKILNIA